MAEYGTRPSTPEPGRGTLTGEIAAAIRSVLAEALPPAVQDPTSPDRYVLVRSGYSREAVRRPPLRKHTFEDMDSMAAYAKRHLGKERAVLFCAPTQMVLVFDDSDATEWGMCPYPVSLEVREWLGISSIAETPKARTAKHSDFKEFVEDHAAHLTDGSLVAAVAQFKMRTEIVYEAELDTPQSFGIVFQSKEGHGSTKLPKTFDVDIPLFRGANAKRYVLTFKMTIKDPRHQEDGQTGVIFAYGCKNWEETRETAVNDLVAEAELKLGDGWLVVRGEPSPRP